MELEPIDTSEQPEYPIQPKAVRPVFVRDNLTGVNRAFIPGVGFINADGSVEECDLPLSSLGYEQSSIIEP